LSFIDHSPEIGGGHTYETELMRSLMLLAHKSKHSFVVFSNRYVDPEARPVSVDTPKIEFTKYPIMPWIERARNSIKTKFNVARIYLHKESHFDRLVRALDVEFLWFVDPKPVLTDIPYLTTVWDLQHRLQPWFPEVSSNGIWDVRETLNYWFLKRAAFVVTGNQVGKQELEQFYQIPHERIYLLPLMTPNFALGQSQQNNGMLEKYGIAKNFLFYPAQFWAHKNHVNLLYAVRELNDKYDLNYPVVFVGSDQGNLDHVKTVTSDLGLGSQVHFLGFVPQEDLIALYQDAFALVYVSFFGPENLPPMEAFGLGCPVIAANVNGATEQFGNAALLVDPAKSNDIALAIKHLHDEPKLKDTLCKRGLEKATEWTADDYVIEMFRLFDEFSPIRRCWKV